MTRRQLGAETDPTVAVAARDAGRLVQAISRVILGKDDVVRLVVTALAAGGHVLIEDVPGVGKTTLARALAAASGASFRRIQFTSDLLPSDILGTSVYDERSATFEFRRGPVFAEVVLADEINRATPKTQSALLEAMSDGTVTIDGITHALPDPFMVIATQNPMDHSGTFPLPDSQLDRFLLRTQLGHPAQEHETALLLARRSGRLEETQPVLDGMALKRLRGAVDLVFVHEDLVRWIVTLAQKTREWDAVTTGASPRASLDLLRAAQAHALLAGRDHVVPEDLKTLAVPVLAHRLLARDEDVHGSRLAARLRTLVESVPLPA